MDHKITFPPQRLALDLGHSIGSNGERDTARRLLKLLISKIYFGMAEYLVRSWQASYVALPRFLSPPFFLETQQLIKLD